MESLTKNNYFIDDSIWNSVPTEIITREGHIVKTSTDTWQLPIVTESAVIHFEKIKSPLLRKSLQLCISYQIERTSSISGLKYWSDFSRLVLTNETKFNIAGTDSIEEFKERLISLMEILISKAKI